MNYPPVPGTCQLSASDGKSLSSLVRLVLLKVSVVVTLMTWREGSEVAFNFFRVGHTYTILPKHP